MSVSPEDLNHRLKRAIGRGDPAECRQLIAAGAGARGTFTSCEQASFLESAVRADQHSGELVDLLLDAGLDAGSVYDELGEDYWSTPLIKAARIGRLDLVKKLAAAGADPHWKSPSGANAASETLPSHSWQANRSDSTELGEVRTWLADQGVKMDPACRDSRRKLVWAASNPISWPDVPMLLNLGVDAAELNWTPFMRKLALEQATAEDARSMPPSEMDHRDCFNRTPFLLAIAADRQDLAEILVPAGSDLLVQGWCGASALHTAARYGHVDLMEWLIGQGLPVDLKDEFGEPPLHEAVDWGQTAAVRLLLANGADAHVRDKNGYAAIHEANSMEMLELLLEAGAPVDDVSGGGCWPLQSACESGDVEIVRYLLNKGAEPNRTTSGGTALFSATGSGSLEVVKLLLEAGADPNIQDCDGWTCLWRVDSLPMAELLLRHGADPSIGDECGCLPEAWTGLPLAVGTLLKKWRLEGLANNLAGMAE